MSTIINFQEERALTDQNRFIAKVYAWMSIAMLITAFTSLYVVNTDGLLEFIFGTRYVFMALIIGELLLVGSLVGFIQKISSAAATYIFIAYSVLNGLTLSVVFLAYTAGSIASTFFVTAGMFGIMSLIGYYTKKDLTKLGSLLFMALIGVIIGSIVNMFIANEMLYWITTYIGIIVFVGLIAYDTQKIKNMNVGTDENDESYKKGAIIGALALYLDFVNLFLLLLRIFGKRR